MDAQTYVPVPARVDARGRRFLESIRPCRSEDLPAIAAIHADSGTPGLLSDLGREFLERVYYRGILDSPLAETYVLDLEHKPAGFVTLSIDSDRLFVQVMIRRWPLAMSLIAKVGLRHPHVLLNLAETVLSVRRHRLDEGVLAEVVSLEVDRRYQGIGLGLFLLERALDRLREQGCDAIKSRTLALNPSVERLYLNSGFQNGGSFRLHGRDWHMLIWRSRRERVIESD
jgi:GNAT superfamily N-acetyltransferase